MSKPIIGFVGMTHLGLNSAVAGAERGFSVVCFDPDTGLIGRLKQGQMPVVEPDLDQLAAKNAARLSYTAEAADLARADVIYVAIDVATDDTGASDLGPLDRLLDITFAAARPDAAIVVLSQVPPGYTRKKIAPGRKLYYQVETLIFGRAIERALYPERYIIGCADPALPLDDAYKAFLLAHDCPLLPMRFESAELAKISINCCLVASISVANTLAEICEGIGAAWDEIAPALKLDRRIGPYSYLSPGLGIAGGNLERDLATVCRIGDSLNSDTGVVRAWVENSQYRKGWAARAVQAAVLQQKPDALLAVWGLAYKENTHSVKNSPSLATIGKLPTARLQVHDPVVPATAVKHPHVTGMPSALEAAAGADALLLLTPWQEYKGVDPALLARTMKGRDIFDPYGLLDGQACVAAGFTYHTLGRAPDAPASATAQKVR